MWLQRYHNGQRSVLVCNKKLLHNQIFVSFRKKPVIVENIKEDRYSGRVSIVFAINAIFEVQRFIQLLVL